MSAWLYLIVAFGSWFTAGVIVGGLMVRRRATPESSPGTDQGITTPGAGAHDLAPGVAPNQP